MLDGNPTQDGPHHVEYRMFRGPSPYLPQTPWRPWAAGWTTVGILVAALVPLAVVAVLLVQFAHVSVTGVWLGLITTPVQQLLLIGFTWLAARKYGASPREVMALHKPVQGWKAYAISFLVFLAGIMIMGAVINAIDPNANKADLVAFQEMFKSPGWWIALLMVGVGAPVSEELLFRGFLFPAIAKTRLGVLGATLLTSGSWAAIHFYSPLGMLQVFVIGLLFSWILIRTGSLRVTILCHALYNTTLGLLMMAGADGWM